jgi:hypothetical protein
MNVPSEDWLISKIDSLEKALQVAMSTIARASNTVSGKATELVSRHRSEHCPEVLPVGLSHWSCKEYRGYYHTDYTLPSEYFRSNVERPSDLRTHKLDFTYLFEKNYSNPDYIKMGEGKRLRGTKSSKIKSKQAVPSFLKKVKSKEKYIAIRDSKRLKQALEM